VDGEVLSWRKSIRYESLIHLPRRLPGIDLELTFSGMGDASRRFADHGWIVRDALDVSRDPWRYRDYIRGSQAEFTVAKDQNIRLKSGWFSDRSACYLAAGRPVVTEDTGFDAYLDVGEGLFAFKTEDEAVEAIKTIESDPERHRRAAHRIAREHFDAKKVLSDLLSELGLG
jgi:glycosyltransferase involved in cell wall biosynthesis